MAANGQSQGKAAYSHQGPVLSVCWSKDGTKVFSGGADNAGRVLDVSTGQSFQVAQHDAPVKSVKWIEAHGGLLATGSWDKTLRYWDLRTPAPVVTINLPERCYSVDVLEPIVAVATAGKQVLIYNLSNPTVPYKSIISPLRYQMRVVSCFPKGIAIGGAEGRVAMQYTTETSQLQNYTFRAQKQDLENTKNGFVMYAVNDISFHPVHGTFVTCGSDGGITSWDGDARVRIKPFDLQPGPITSTAFNRTGTIMAYSISYDWHRGHSGMTPQQSVQIKLHACTDEEMQRKPRKP